VPGHSSNVRAIGASCRERLAQRRLFNPSSGAVRGSVVGFNPSRQRPPTKLEGLDPSNRAVHMPPRGGKSLERAPHVEAIGGLIPQVGALHLFAWGLKPCD
jgi:hypothetical protein